MKITDEMVEAAYEDWIRDVRDLEPPWVQLPQSHKDRLRSSISAALSAGGARMLETGWEWVPYPGESHQPLYDVLVVGRVQRFYDDAPAYAEALGERLGAISTDTAAREKVEARILSTLASPAQDAEDICPVCAKPINAGDQCATDIELGTCHAECLEGCPTVNLDTGEPSDGPIPTYPYDPVSPAQEAGAEPPVEAIVWYTMDDLTLAAYGPWVRLVDHKAALTRPTPIQAVERKSFQQRVQPWMMACFGPEISADKLERSDRFIEEALELVQAGDYPKERALALVDYVYGRDQGEINQEVGGVMVTLAAHCLAHGVDMHEAAETELARIWTKVDKIRAKQAVKPTGSALPVASPTPESRHD